MEKDIATLQQWIDESHAIVFFGGAGVSTESGIPDFRSTDGLYHQKYDWPPETILSHSFFEHKPEEFYRFYRDKMLIEGAKPNAAHRKLAELERAGKLRAIVTVNIDGIHQEAGSREVLELHGSVMRSWCAKCEKFLDFFYIVDSPTPIAYCNVDMCGDFVRPAIVMREEPYDFALIERAMQLVREADVLLLDASAMAEFPVPNLFHAFQGRKMVVFNAPPFVYDARAGLVVNGDFNEIFSQLDLTKEA